MIKSFLDLEIYQEAFQLSLEIEELVKTYPPEEKYLLTDQTKRSSRSVSSLIAEGYGRRESLKDFQKYLRECVGECNETMNHINLAKYKNYIKRRGYGDELIERYTILGKKIFTLKNKWQNYH